MLRSRYFSLLLILLLVAGPLWAIPAGTVLGSVQGGNSGNILGEGDNAYISQVIAPAKASHEGLSPEQRERYLGIMHRQAVAGQAAPRRDRAGGPDDQGYEYRDSDENGGPGYDWVDIVNMGGAQSWNFGDDDGAWVDLGFNFTWYGNEYNRLWICSNGWVSLSEERRDYNFGAWGGGIPNANAPENWLAPMMTDWYMPDGGTAWFFSDGNQAVVTWDNISYWGEGNNTFQVVLTSDGMVKFQYAQIGAPQGIYLVGAQNQAKDRGFEISINEEGYPRENFAIGLGNQWILFDGPGIAIRPAQLAFGDIAIDHQGVIHAVVSNVGAEQLNITGVECDEEAFLLPNIDREVQLGSGESIQVDVGFAPAAARNYAADIRIRCNAENADNGIFTVRATGRGFSGPVLSVDPQSIDVEQNTGQVEEYTVSLGNDGGADLNFAIEAEIIREVGGRDVNDRGVRNLNGGPNRDNPGELIGQFNGINGQNQYSSCAGWDWDNERMWVTNYNQAVAAAYTHDANYQNFQEVIRINSGNCMDGAWADGILFLGTWANAVVNRYNAAGQNIGALQFPFAVYGLAADVEEELLFALSGNDNTIKVFQLDGNGGLDVNQPIGVIQNHQQYHNNIQAYGLEWVPKHPDGQLWMTAYNQPAVHQIAVDTDNWTCTADVQAIQVSAAGDQPYCGVAHDGHNLWAAGYANANIRVYDDGVAEAYWLLFSPAEGTIEPGGSTDLFVTLDATGLFEGDYEADLHILSNDPGQNDVAVNVHMFVHGAPDIAAEWSDDAGFPDLVNWNGAYADLFTGHAYDVVVKIINAGTAELTVDGAECDNELFTASPDQFVLAAGEEVNVTLTLGAEADGVHEGTMTFFSDDPDESEFGIRVYGETGSAPIIAVEPNSIDEELFTGGSTDVALTVSNDGGSPLRFTIEKEIISEPGRDANDRAIRRLDGSPVRDDAGDLLGQFQGINQQNIYCSPVGWDWDNERMWVTQYNNAIAAAYTHDNNYQNFQEVLRINCGNNMDGCWADGYLWLPTSLGSAQVNRWNSEGQNVGAVNFGFGVYGLAADVKEEWLFVLSSNDWAIHIFNLDGDGNVVGGEIASIAQQNHQQFHGNQVEYGMEWVPGHKDGQLWFCNYTDRNIYQIAVNTVNWQCTAEVQHFQVFPANDQPYSSSAHDGKNMWVGGYGPATIRIYDDGVSEVDWLMTDVDEAEIGAHGSMDVMVTLNAEGLFAGDYQADIHFLSNDVENPDVAVSVVLHVTGASDITVEWDDAVGFPDVIDFNRAFEDLFSGGPYTQVISITNDGSDDLDIQDIYSAQEYFSANPSAFVLAPDESQDVTITFNAPAEDPGDYNTQFTIQSNDPDEGEFTFNAHADADLPPMIVVDPNAIEDDLVTGEIHEHTLNISNDGDALLRFVIEKEIISEPGDRDANDRQVRSLSAGPNRDDAGELIAQFQGINAQNQYSSCIGWDWDNERMWVTNYISATAAAYSHDNAYQNFQEEIRINPGSCMDGCWAEGMLFLPNFGSNVVNRYDAAGQMVGAVQFPFGVYGLAADVEEGWLFALSSNDWQIHVFELDGDGGVNVNQQIGAIANHQQFHANQQVYGLEWVGLHADGQLWMTSPQDARVHQILVDTDNWTCTAEAQAFAVFPGADQPYSSVAHDGKNLWASGYTPASIRIYDDGNAEISWLTFSPEEGELASGADMDLSVVLNGVGLLGGEYEASLHVLSNDPHTPDTEINIRLSVTGAPDIEGEWADRLGYPDILDFNRGFDDIFSGGPYTLQVEIFNTGTEELAVTDAYGEVDVFTVDPDNFVLAVGESRMVDIVFNSAEPEEYNSRIVFPNNSNAHAEYAIAVHAGASLPPIIVVDPSQIQDDLNTGEIHQHTLNISNDGDAELRFTTDSEIISEPGDRDGARRHVRALPGAVRVDVPAEVIGFNANAVIPTTDPSWNDRQINNLGAVSQARQASGPRRDELEANFAYFKESDGWGNIEAIWQAAGANMTMYSSNDMGNFPINDFDVIWIREYQSDGFNTAWNNNRERFEDWIDGGGTLYHATATNNWGVVPVSPGGIQRLQEGSGNGTVAVSQDPNAENYNYLAELMGWNGGENLPGSSWSHSSYDVNAIDQLENSDWFQVIATNQGNAQRAGVAVYNFGRGWVVVSGTTDSHQYANFRNAGNWGLAVEQLPAYFDYLANQSQWLSWEPEQGTIGSGGDMDVIVTLDATGLLGGDYVAGLHFLSNDPATPDVEVAINMTVTGQPVVAAEWIPGFENNLVDFNAAFQDLFTGGPYTVPVTVSNAGTEDLAVEDIHCDNEYFTADPTEFVLAPGEEQIVSFVINADENGDHQGTMTISSNAINAAEYGIAVRGVTSSPPRIVVDPQGISEELFAGESTEIPINIANEGDALLRWSSDVEILAEGARDGQARTVRSLDGSGAPKRDDAGELLGQFQGINQQNVYCSPVGWDWDNERMWVTQYNNAIAVAYTHDNDYRNFQEVLRIQCGNNMDGCWVDGYLFVPTSLGSAQVNRWDAAGQNIGAINFNFGVYGLAADIENEWLFVLSSNDWAIHVFNLDGEGNIVGGEIGAIAQQDHMQFHGNQIEYGMEWVPKHAEGQLWFVNYTNARIYQIGVDTDNWRCTGEVQNFPVLPGQDQPYTSSAHDGHNMWVGGYGPATIRVYDDGVFEPYWLMYAPQEGELQGGADENIMVTLNAYGLLGGRYEADLTIYNNDPADPEVVVNIVLNVTGVGNIDATPGGPEEGDVPADFGVGYIGYRKYIPIRVENVGTDVLTVSEVNSDNEDFGVEANFPFDVAIGEYVDLAAWFDPSDVGNARAVLSFATNDPNYGDGYPVTVIGNGMGAPNLDLSRNEVAVDLFTGEGAEEVVNLSNSGESVLNWETELEVISEPERDNAARHIRSLAPERPVNVVDNEMAANVRRGISSTDASWNENHNQPLNPAQPVVHNPVGPRRDVPESNYLLIQETNPWGYDLEQIFREEQGLSYTRIRTPDQLDQLDINDFDAIWFGNYESDAWTQQYNNHLGMIEDWVDAGGSYYMSSGTNNWGVAPTHPGGLVRTPQVYDNTGLTVLTQEENFLFDLMDWDQGTQLQGNSFCHAVYDANNLDAIENTDGYQVMVVASNGNRPAIINYNFGRGWCVVAGSTDGFLHNAPNQYLWGAAGLELLYYLDFLSNQSRWLEWAPEEGALEAGADADVILTFVTDGLIGGDYEADLHFYSNDPADPDQVVSILMNVTGAPVMEVTPANGSEIDFPRTYVEGASSSAITIANVGTDVLVIEDVQIDNGDEFDAELDANTQIAVGAEITFNVIFHPIDIGERNGNLTITSNAANMDNGTTFSLVGVGMTPPQISTSPAADGELFQSVPLGSDPIDRSVTISNVADNGGDNLVWAMSGVDVGQGRDVNARQVRSLSAGPNRDNAGDQLATFDAPLNTIGGMAFDGTNMWGCSYGSGRMCALDLNGNTVANIAIHASPLSMTFDGEKLWIGQWSGQTVRTYNLNGDLIESFDFNFNQMSGMGSDGEGLVFINSLTDQRIHVINAANHNEVTSFTYRDAMNNDNIWGITWVPGHRDGQLWGTSGGRLYQAFVDENWNVQSVQNFGWNADQPYVGPAHDGFNMWHGMWGAQTWYVFDDGVEETYWFTFNPKSGSLAPGESENVTVTFNSEGLDDGADYHGVLTIESNDPSDPTVNINITLHVGQMELPYQFTETAENHSVLVTGVAFEDEPVANGWVVGVFTPAGVCAGADFWRGEDLGLAVWGADQETAPDQFTAGQRMNFRIWDPNAETDYAASASVSEGNLSWTANGYTVLSLNHQNAYTCVVPFTAGWNLISINVTPPAEMNNANGPDIRQMMSQFRIDAGHHHVILMKNERGNFYAPANRDFNNIPFFNTAEGYQVRVDQALEGSWTGVQIDAQADVPIAAGWNMIAYYPTYQLTCSRNSFTAISPIVDNVVLAKDGVGHFASPRNNFSNMAPWQEGKGYQINVNAAVVLNYPQAQQGAAAVELGNSESTVVGRWAEPAITGANMSVLVTGVSGINLSADDQIAAFSTSGRLVGVGRVTEGMVGLAVWGDDISTEVVDGLVAGEAFTLKLWDADKGSVVDLRMEGLVYQTDGFTAADAAASVALPNEFYVGQNFPNPFNAVTRVAFGLPEASHVSIRVFDVAGREVATLVSGNLEAGHHTAVWSAEGFNSGVYLVKMETPNYSDVRKVTLVK